MGNLRSRARPDGLTRLFYSCLVGLFLCVLMTTVSVGSLRADAVLVPMGEQQTNHLRAYGVAYRTLRQFPDATSHWLLNFQGGAFLLPNRGRVKRQLNVKGVEFRVITSSREREISRQIKERNARKVPLEKAPEIAVYTPPGKDPWDDAVTLALNYADIPFDKVYDRDVLNGRLQEYDWVHLHHEDFSGQYGKFYANYRNRPWYMEKVREAREMADELGFESVQAQKKTVAKRISEYVSEGGFLFAMCSATETLDVALATLGLNSAAPEISGTPVEPNLREKMSFDRTLAFTNFELVIDPTIYAHSNIDVSPDPRQSSPRSERFELFDFSARYDPIPAMLTQNHKEVIKGFLGQSSSYNPDVIKEHVTEMAYLRDGRVKYLYGSHGEGIFSFYSGHDPEDFAHYVGDPHTTLSAHPNSPGYRLILNNILFPAAKKPDLKT
jgi:hypothetical protein